MHFQKNDPRINRKGRIPGTPNKNGVCVVLNHTIHQALEGQSEKIICELSKLRGMKYINTVILLAYAMNNGVKLRKEYDSILNKQAIDNLRANISIPLNILKENPDLIELKKVQIKMRRLIRNQK